MFGVSYMVNALNPQKTNLMQKMHIFILNMNLSQHKLYVNISKIKTIYSFSLKKSKCSKNHRQCYVIFIIQRTEFLSRTDCQIKIKKFLSNYCWSFKRDTRSYTQTHDFANIEHLHGFHIFIYHMKL